jgi:hypothetical protein
VVYGRVNSLEKACVASGRKLDKKTAHQQLGAFAHLILWIFMGFSTIRASNCSKIMVEAARL